MWGFLIWRIDSYLATSHVAYSAQAASDPFQRQVRHLLEGHVVRQHVPRDIAYLLPRPHPRSFVENVPHRLQLKRQAKKLWVRVRVMVGPITGPVAALGGWWCAHSRTSFYMYLITYPTGGFETREATCSSWSYQM